MAPVRKIIKKSAKTNKHLPQKILQKKHVLEKTDRSGQTASHLSFAVTELSQEHYGQICNCGAGVEWVTSDAHVPRCPWDRHSTPHCYWWSGLCLIEKKEQHLDNLAQPGGCILVKVNHWSGNAFTRGKWEVDSLFYEGICSYQPNSDLLGHLHNWWLLVPSSFDVFLKCFQRSFNYHCAVVSQHLLTFIWNRT